MPAGAGLFMTAMTPHASFDNKTEVVRWSVDLRYQDFSVPSNLGEVPEDYTPERDPVTMACHPGEAYFVIQDKNNPEREMIDPSAFAKLTRSWTGVKVDRPGRGWTPLNDRETPT